MEASQTTQRAYTQSALTRYNSQQSASFGVFAACATFALGSVLRSKMFDFKEVPQSDFWQTDGDVPPVEDQIITQKNRLSHGSHVDRNVQHDVLIPKSSV